MKSILLSFFLLLSVCAVACSCAPYYSFCEARYQIPNDVTILGQIIDTNSSRIRIKRSETIHGIEQRDTITVWNDTNFNCNGFVSMKASGIGKPGDTIIIHLPRIDSMFNAWDVVGDYRRPYYLCAQSTLTVFNDTVRGLVNQSVDQSVIPPVYTFYDTYALNDFVAFTKYNNGDCVAIRDSTFDYIPFPESNVSWKESGGNAHTSPFCYEEEYQYSKDTLINGITYHQLKGKSIAGNIIGTSCIAPYVLGGIDLYYRNDTVNKSVYFIDSAFWGNYQEHLAYDFDLEIGDTLPNTLIARSTLPSERFVIDSIDFVFEAGRYRKRYIFYAPLINNYQYILEGIGSSAGLIKDLNHLSGLCCITSLDCFTLNGSPNLLSGGSGSCSLISSLNEPSAAREKIKVYPNPSSGVLHINTEIPFVRAEIYTIQGQLVKSIETNLEKILLPEENGLYHIQFITQTGKKMAIKAIRK